MMEIMKFRSRETVKRYIQFQRSGDNPMKYARVRMRKYPFHKWANRVGNVATIECGSSPGGNLYLFEDGCLHVECMEGLPE